METFPVADEEPQDENAPAGDGTEGQDGQTEGAGSKRLSKKKLILFIVLPVVLVVALLAGLYFSGVLDPLIGKKKETGEHGEMLSADGKGGHAETGSYYYDLPDLIVNLSDAGNKQRFLKLSISLEMEKKEDEVKLKTVMPRITDQFQTYLRELRVEDLRGSAGIYRLRQELLARVQVAAEPVKVRDVLFREILVQ
jgi:flagellar FliL protein